MSTTVTRNIKYRRLEKSPRDIRTTTYSTLHAGIESETYARDPTATSTLTVNNLPYLIIIDLLKRARSKAQHSGVGQTGGSVRRGENPRRLAGRHL